LNDVGVQEVCVFNMIAVKQAMDSCELRRGPLPVGRVHAVVTSAAVEGKTAAVKSEVTKVAVDEGKSASVTRSSKRRGRSLAPYSKVCLC